MRINVWGCAPYYYYLYALGDEEEVVGRLFGS